MADPRADRVAGSGTEPLPAATDGLGADVVLGAVRSLFDAPRRTSGVRALCGGLLVGLVSWYFGTDVAHAVMVGVVAAVAGLVWAAVPAVRDVAWHDAPRDSGEGARHDIVRLSAALRPRFGRVRTSALRPVRELAARRLALQHLDLDALQDRSEIERLIGTAAYGVLRSDRRRPPRLRSLLRCLDTLDTLDALDASDARERSGSTVGSRHDR